MVKSTSHPVASALGAIALWATLAAIAVQVKQVPAFLTLAVTLAIGGLVGVVKWREWRLHWQSLLLGVAGIAGYHWLLFSAFKHAPAVEANLINYLWPVLIVLLSRLSGRGGKLTPPHIAGALMGFAGAVLLVTEGKLGFQAQYLFGYALALGAALAWSLYSVLSARFPDIPTAQVGLICLLSAVVAIAGHWITEPSYAIQARDWPWLIALGVGPMGLAFFLWDRAMKTGDARLTGTLAYLTPLGSTLLLAATQDKPLATTTIVAAALILGGMVVAGRAAQ